MPRKKPFSIKQKKVQLQHKRQKKSQRPADSDVTPVPTPSSDHSSLDSDSDNQPGPSIKSHDTHSSSTQSHGVSHDPPPLDNKPDAAVFVDRLNQQPKGLPGKYDPNRYKLHFEKESKAEIERRKLIAKKEFIRPVAESSLEVGVDDIYQPGSVLDIPKRPPWNYSMTKEEVEGQEVAMFERYLENIYSNYKPEKLSYFENNLETWRQLWRVQEISDVILLITDVRHPSLHFSPALYNYVVNDLKKEIVLILNKVDLVPPQVAVAWRHYFLSKFPQLSVICFTSYPNQEVSMEPSKKVHLKFKRGRGGRLPSAVGPRELFHVIEDMYRGKIDMGGWKEKVSDGTTLTTPTTETLPGNDYGSGSDSEGEGGVEPGVTMETSKMASNPLVKDSVEAGVLTIGMVGHPNVGKSSIINGLQGKKVVSTSRTPGHTKHFQTIFLTPSVRLCDCPGLVFPSLIDKQLQVLSGIYPIAQVREPYTAVGYITQRVPLIELLRLQHPLTVATVAKKTKGKRTGDFELELEDPNLSHLTLKSTPPVKTNEEAYHKWTAWDVCDAWAEKRGYYTAKSARLDTYRAANSLLRLAVDGRICMYFTPPGFTKEKASWEAHHEVAEMMELQQLGISHRASFTPCNDPVSSVVVDKENTRNELPQETSDSEPITENKFAALLYMDDS